MDVLQEECKMDAADAAGYPLQADVEQSDASAAESAA